MSSRTGRLFNKSDSDRSPACRKIGYSNIKSGKVFFTATHVPILQSMLLITAQDLSVIGRVVHIWTNFKIQQIPMVFNDDLHGILCHFPCFSSIHTVSIHTSNIEHVGCISIHCR